MPTIYSKNPFNPGSGAYPPFLAGRGSQLESFQEMLNDLKDNHPENRLLVGLRGTGKTVLLDEFYRMCIENNFLPIRRSQFTKKHCDPNEFTKVLKYDIRTAVESFSKINRIKGTFNAAVSFLKPKKIGVPDAIYFEPSYDSSSRVPLEDHLKKYLEKNWNVFEKSNYNGVIFLYDEFHTINDLQSKSWYVLSDFIGVLNDVQKKGCNYNVVFAGLPNLQLNITKARSYTERMFKTINVDNLSIEEAIKAITEPLKGSSYKFSKNLVRTLVRDSGGYPYFIQFYCKETISNLNKKNISDNDYQRIKPIIIKQLEDDFFDSRLEKLSEDERTALFAMAKINSVDIKFESIKNYSQIPRTTLSKTLQRLEQKGLVYNFKRGVYRFSIPLLLDYLKRKLK